MRRMNLFNVAIDKRLEDALYVRANGRRISRPFFPGNLRSGFRDGVGDMSGAGE